MPFACIYRDFTLIAFSISAAPTNGHKSHGGLGKPGAAGAPCFFGLVLGRALTCAALRECKWKEQNLLRKIHFCRSVDSARIDACPVAQHTAAMEWNADRVIESFDNAKEENVLDRYRNGQVVELPPDHEVWMTGDIHDHRTNFKKLVGVAKLDENPNRHLILHELLHGDHFDNDGREDSWKMLHEAAELKCDFPDQVHFLMANHDLAQIHGEGIMKAGLSVCEAFNKAIKRDFPGHDMSVQVAITEFLLSLPLAIRCPNGLWFSHSLPADENIDGFDYGVFERTPLTPADYAKRVGPVYQLIWGRKYTESGVKRFAEKVGASLFVTGHQPQESGSTTVGDQLMIVDSSHNQGVFLPLSTSEEYTVEAMQSRLRKFVAVDLDAD